MRDFRLLASCLLAASTVLVAGCSTQRAIQSEAAKPLPEAGPTACADADLDGVCDAVDRCPMTPANLAVDSTGCPAPMVAKVGAAPAPAPAPVPAASRVTFSAQALFADGQSALLPESKPEIERLAAQLKSYPGTTVLIEGHTDNRGTPANNQRLSLARANAVRNELVEHHGIAPSRIRTLGLADQQPVAGNRTEEGRALNRRIEAKIQDSNDASL